GEGAVVSFERGDILGADLDHGDDVAQVPVLDVGELACIAVLVAVTVAAGSGPLDEAAEDRAAGRAGAAAAGEERQLLGRRLLAEGSGGGEGESGESRG